MAFFLFNGKKLFIDNRLKIQIDKNIINDLKRKDKDVVFVVDGPERSGKSVFSQVLGAYIASVLQSPFDLSNICMNPNEFRNKIQTAKNNEVVIYDEAHRGMGSVKVLSEINQILKDLMMEMGQKNLCVFIVLPSYFLLDKYVALFRSRGLFHIYERRRRRGYWCYFNEKRKLRLYIKGKREFNYNCMKWPYFRGRFFNQYSVGEEEYRAKKKKSFTTKARISKAEHYIAQRNRLIFILSKEYGIPLKGIENMCKFYNIGLSRSTIKDILHDERKNWELEQGRPSK